LQTYYGRIANDGIGRGAVIARSAVKVRLADMELTAIDLKAMTADDGC